MVIHFQTPPPHLRLLLEVENIGRSLSQNFSKLALEKLDMFLEYQAEVEILLDLWKKLINKVYKNHTVLISPFLPTATLIFK